MSNTTDIQEALHMNIINKYPDPHTRLIICIKKHITLESGEVVDLDNGHFGLIAAHSTGIAFNSWDINYENTNIWYPEYPNIKFNTIFTANDFYNWRTYSFRKLILQVNSDKEFENIKLKLIRDEIPFRMCGEVAFGKVEVGIVVFPLTKERTPKYLQFLKVFK
jgi:hypothetical protein